MQNRQFLSRRQALSALAGPAALVATGVGLAALPAEPDAALRDLFAWREDPRLEAAELSPRKPVA